MSEKRIWTPVRATPTILLDSTRIKIRFMELLSNLSLWSFYVDFTVLFLVFRGFLFLPTRKIVSNLTCCDTPFEVSFLVCLFGSSPNVMTSLRCHGDSDCNKTQIIRNFHLYLIQLWQPFSHIFINADVVNAQTWEVSALKNPVKPPKL